MKEKLRPKRLVIKEYTPEEFSVIAKIHLQEKYGVNGRGGITNYETIHGMSHKTLSNALRGVGNLPESLLDEMNSGLEKNTIKKYVIYEPDTSAYLTTRGTTKEYVKK